MTLIYVDVSHHDWDRRGGQLDWAKIRTATSPAMCARATYGDPSGFHPTTRYFADLQRGAKAAGFGLRGAYHNLVHGDATSMRRQVDWFRRTLDAEGCHWAMVDIERYAELISNGLWPRWDDCLRWQDAWYAVDDRPMTWYLPAWLVRDYYPDTTDLRRLRGPLVQSHYAGGDGTAQQIYAAAGGDTGTGWDDIYGNRRCDIWQYTDTGNVPGASSYTDCNAYRGSLEQLTTLLTGAQPITREDDDMAGTFFKIKDGAPGADGRVWYLPPGGPGRVYVNSPTVWRQMEHALGLPTPAPVVEVESAAALDLLAPLPQPAAVTDAQVQAIADRLAAAPDNPLGDADKPAIVAAVKQALAEGVA
jgi:hypothetical protein